jgi:hypothetical protein
MAIIAENWRIVKWLGGAILADYFLVFYAMVHGLGFWQYPYGYRCKGTAGETGEQEGKNNYLISQFVCVYHLYQTPLF